MISAPRLVLNETVCQRNIERMVKKIAQLDISFRPHFKTHQSIEIGEWFRPYGIDKIAVSSLEMAMYFADRWKDIMVAVPVNPGAIDTINELAVKVELGLLFENLEAVHAVSAELKHPVNGFVKIDTGYHRAGILAEDLEAIAQIVNAMQGDKINHRGFVAHAGHSYDCRGVKEIMEMHQASIREFNKVISHFGPDHIYSYGDTPSCSVAEQFEGVNELRPGNFVFYDLAQVQIGSCKAEDIAVAMECPIIGLHPERNEILIHGGSVHFSKDVMEVDGVQRYGLVVAQNGETLETPVNLFSLSQEHGKIRGNSEFFSQAGIGDVLTILPVHSCLTADKHPSYTGVVNNVIYSKM